MPPVPSLSSSSCAPLIVKNADETQRQLSTLSVYSKRQRVFFFFLTCSAARVAVSNTSRTPSFDLAEHSK